MYQYYDKIKETDFPLAHNGSNEAHDEDNQTFKMSKGKRQSPDDMRTSALWVTIPNLVSYLFQMNDSMSSKVSMLGKCTTTDITSKWSFSSMNTNMIRQSSFVSECLVTEVTFKWTLSCMASHMDF